jgi:hypothetical protein
MNKRIYSLLLPNRPVSYDSLKEEQKICVEFANHMRQLTLAGNFPYIWFHVANEFIPSTRKNFSFDLKQKHMGKISGIADYCIMGDKDSFLIEFKTGKGKQSDNQKVFEEWCNTKKVPYYICRSAKEGIDFVEGKLKALRIP